MFFTKSTYTPPNRHARLTPDNQWYADFYRASPLFKSIECRFGAEISQWQHWPDADTLNALAAGTQPTVHTGTGTGQPIRFVATDTTPQHEIAAQYEHQIYLTGAVPTRPASWHDFFGALCWMLFPKTKASLNSLHYQASVARTQQLPRNNQRSPIENAATLFDESGAVVISCDQELLEMIRAMRWKELFWNQRDRTRAHLHVVVFGHALYEKALRPYVGLTAQTVLVELPPAEFAQKDIPGLDKQIAQWWIPSRTPRDLVPFPILGLPGFSADNETESYYDNTHYFRTSRR